MNKMKSAWAVAKINFKHGTWISYMTAGICIAAMIVDIILDSVLKIVGDTSVAPSSMLYLICVMAPVFIASVNYSKLMNIGVKKKQYFAGCIINYVVFAAVVSLVGMLELYLVDNALNESGKTIYNLIHVFGWDGNVFTAFFSQFMFLLMVESAIHTLVFMQTKWYGWVADVAIVAVISVFTPIPALRSAEEFFFNAIIFSHPVVQTAVCAVLAAAFYATNLYYLKKRI